MDPLGIARWQFGITTVYHSLFVPITIGMAFFIAIMETAWVHTRKSIYLRATKFWGKIFLINFAIGVVTGITQEFHFGMNWSNKAIAEARIGDADKRAILEGNAAAALSRVHRPIAAAAE